MRQLNISTRDLERLSTYSYEHIRKILNGLSVQSEDCNAALCKALGMKEDEMWALAKREKMLEKYSDEVFTGMFHAPNDTFIRDAWPDLTNYQKDRLKKIVEGMVEENRSSR
jgi:hypothetical protein